ncbi:hypothetical protein ABZ816_00655 [Actinosynnema sp. NPDC047251]|uniref:Uncharacterized protein n=1 Tax=Saccharothrix espanaensis (strain ATCC 51144 / DSM 44229 / JCM 9112 / NBRC 15066 / NRRL 15764) TaxID=1179773 RepID=K0K2H7_SACES|nr:hypothetical protein [Saccharothrix espanaensis]CCH30758.1 hypothetical protein BN6_34600 [Saccharothrix espanaensis DSM 44229]
MDLPDELRDRLSGLDIDLLHGRLRPEVAVWLACDLLVAGVDTPAVVDLAGESPTRLTAGDAMPIVREVLAELGFGPVDLTQRPWAVARDVARRVAAGTLPPEVGVGYLYWMWPDCDHHDVIRALLPPLDEWHDALPSQRDEEALRARMRELARDVVLVADQRLAG